MEINEPIITTQSELCQTWEKLMGPFGYGSRSLWLMLIRADGTPLRQLTEIEDVPERPEPELLDNLMRLCEHLVDSEHVSIAFLLSRPGRDGISASDRAWGLGLIRAARRAVLPIRPLHRANDDNVQAVTPDDIGFHGAA
jgi:hypothetical protein